MNLLYRFVIVLFMSVVAFPAAAGVFVWKDSASDVAVSFPDTWARVHNQKSNDILTIAAPGVHDYASCRVRVSDDKRFVIYPRSYARNIQHVYMSKDFWLDYFGEFSGVKAHHFYDDAGLGDAAASRVEVSFITPGQPKMLKRGFMHAGLYDGQIYVFECSAEYDAYDKWRPVFHSVLKSVQIDDQRGLGVTSGYRDFMADKPLLIHNTRPVDMYSY